MSRDWTFYCEDCSVSSQFEINHGEETLREIYALRDPLLLLVEAVGYDNDWLEVKVRGSYRDDLWSFLRRHYEHEVCLRDEYGCMEPLACEGRLAPVVPD
jgi:hypothetical protein